MPALDPGKGNLVSDLARLLGREGMGLLSLLEQTDPHLLTTERSLPAHLSGSCAATRARNPVGAGRKHREVEKGQANDKKKIPPSSVEEKKKKAPGLGQGNCKFERNRTDFTSKAISNNKRKNILGDKIHTLAQRQLSASHLSHFSQGSSTTRHPAFTRCSC